jgi:hypothetical protein
LVREWRFLFWDGSGVIDAPCGLSATHGTVLQILGAIVEVH